MIYLIFKHRRYISHKFSVEYKFGYLEQPAFKSDKKMKRYYLRLSGERRIKNFILDGFVRVDRAENYDKNPSPVQFDISDENKIFITLGLGVSWRF